MDRLEVYMKTHLAPSTVKRYRREIDFFVQLKTKEFCQQASYSDVMAFIGLLREKYPTRELTTALAALKHYYHHLIEQGIRTDHPCRYVRLRDKRSRDIQLQDLFSSNELELLYNRPERYALLKHRNQVITGLLIYQGLTSGEVASLTLESINLEKGTVTVKPSSKLNGRTLKLKAVQMHAMFKYMYEGRGLLMKQETDRLIIGKLGEAEGREGIGYIIDRSKGLFPDRKLNARTVRQSVIANWLKEGKDLRIVQVMAGHKYPSSTEKYRTQRVEELKHEVLKHHPLR